MARTPLTVNSITNGGGTPVDVQDELAAWHADDHSFANGTDMRTFIVVKNASGATRDILFEMPLEWDGANGNPMPTWARKTGTTLVAGYFATEIDDAKTLLFGPFRPYWFNQTDATVNVDIDANANVTVAAFALPWYDGIHGESSGTVEPNVGGGVYNLAVETISAAETIVPEGLEPSFDDHSILYGWILPLNTMRRRMVWIRNNTAGNVIVTQSGGDLYAPKLSSGSAAEARIYIRRDTMAAADEWFLGPWDERVWSGANDNDTGNTHLWLRTDSGVSADVDIAWLELGV